MSQTTTMVSMFYYANSFDQDLSGWCLDDGVDLSDAFRGDGCTLSKCGVHYKAEGTCAPTPAPTPIQTSAAGAAAARRWSLGFLGGAALLLLYY